VIEAQREVGFHDGDKLAFASVPTGHASSRAHAQDEGLLGRGWGSPK